MDAKSLLNTWIVLGLLTVLTACGGGGGSSDKPAPAALSPAALSNGVPLPDYNALKADQVSTKSLRMTSSPDELEARIKNGLRATTKREYAGVGRGTFKTGYNYIPFRYYDFGAPVAEAASGLRLRSAISASDIGLETDKGDLIKDDGSHLFVYSPGASVENAGKIRIFSIDSNAASAEFKSELQLPDKPFELNSLYLQEQSSEANMLITVGHQTMASYAEPRESISAAYGEVGVSIYGVSDTSAVSQIRKFAIDGQLVASQKLGDKLYITTQSKPWIDSLEGFWGFYPSTPSEEGLAEMRERNERKLIELTLSNLLPAYSVDESPRQSLSNQQSCLVLDDAEAASGYITLYNVTTIDLAQQKIIDSICLNTPVSGVFAAASSVYFGVTVWSHEPDQIGLDNTIADYRTQTSLHKFALTDQGARYQSTGAVDGAVRWDAPQLRMDEYNGDLRILTTDERDGLKHSLHIMQEGANGLEPLATLPNSTHPAVLGKAGEEINNVWFLGDSIFVASLDVEAPLQHIDAATPSAPTNLGSVAMPSDYNYLHKINSNWLLAIGADVAGKQTDGINVELFSLNQGAAVSAGEVAYGAARSFSAAQSRHNAITFDRPNGSDTLRISLPSGVWFDDNALLPLMGGWRAELKLLEVIGISTTSATLTDQGSLTSAVIQPDINFNSEYSSPPDTELSFKPPYLRGLIRGNSLFLNEETDVLGAFWNTPNVVNRSQ